MSDGVDYEDLTGMQLDRAQLDSLVGTVGECVFNWTTRDGYPVGVVVAYVYHEGTFFTTCAERRKRVPALRTRPQSAIVVNRGGRTASFKGDSTVHAPGDDGFEELKAWFYPKLSGLDRKPDDTYIQSFARFLDSPNRVIIETDARLVVGFDSAKFAAFTTDAMATEGGESS
ncbi:MAG: hypothetical protein AAGA93_17995 [Actinomycetota bacterium]